jgi:hypothetical protein
MLKKSFGGGGRNFLEPLTRFARDDVRDLFASQKTDYGPLYQRYGASQRWDCPKISICEVLGVLRFSTFQQHLPKAEVNTFFPPPHSIF